MFKRTVSFSAIYIILHWLLCGWVIIMRSKFGRERRKRGEERGEEREKRREERETNDPLRRGKQFKEHHFTLMAIYAQTQIYVFI